MTELKNMWREGLFALMLFFALIQIFYYWIIFRRLAFYNGRYANDSASHPVSVVVCAKNEVQRLRKYLTALLEQAYHQFEVIVVNDCSWDETGEFLETITDPHLKVVTIKEQEKYRHGKKFALTLGIKAAQHEALLMTDADCLPASKNWLTLMQRHLNKEKEIVLGYGPYLKESGFLNKLIRFDAFFNAIQYFSFALGNNAYMGVGRNLSYKKSVFFRNKGFAKHNHILSGDDDLFVNENATKTNVAVELDPESFTYTEPKKSFGEWLTQKKRHLTTGKYYRGNHKTALFFQSFSSFMFYTLMITLLVAGFDWKIVLSLYGGVLLLKLPVIYKSAVRLKEKDLLWLYPLLDVLNTILQPIFYIAQLFSKPKSWK